MRTKLRSVYKRFHTRFGAPGVVAMLALFVAMGGTAAVAGDQLAKSSAKAKKGPRGPRGPTGPPGLAGPAGPQGPQGIQGLAGLDGDDGAPGADGDNGAPGTPGTNGTNGKTVLSGTATPNAGIGTLGDFYIETDVNQIYGPKAAAGPNGGWGNPTNLQGPPGADGSFGGTLPAGITVAGTWAFDGSVQTITDGNDNPVQIGNTIEIAPISFPGAVDSPQTYSAHWAQDPDFEDFCPGSAPNPLADPGHLCVYLSFDGLTNASLLLIGDVPLASAVGRSGAMVAFSLTEGISQGRGSWALTTNTP
jgi:hypothetical protein